MCDNGVTGGRRGEAGGCSWHAMVGGQEERLEERDEFGVCLFMYVSVYVRVGGERMKGLACDGNVLVGCGRGAGGEGVPRRSICTCMCI